MNAPDWQKLVAEEKFLRLHPTHVRPGYGGEPFDITVHPSPTTDHILVVCGCGYRMRYTARELTPKSAA